MQRERDVTSSVSCQSRAREEEKSVQHLLGTGAQRRTEIRRRHRQKWGGFSVSDPRTWMFWNRTSSPAVDHRSDFILSMRYVKRLDRPVVAHKHTRWRSSSTEWDSWPTKQWAGKSRHREGTSAMQGCDPRPERWLSCVDWRASLLCRSGPLSCVAVEVTVAAWMRGFIDWAQQGGAYPQTDRWGGSGRGTQGAGLCLRTHTSQARAGEPQGPPTCWGRGCKQARFVLLINYNLPPPLKHRQHQHSGWGVMRGESKSLQIKAVRV